MRLLRIAGLGSPVSDLETQVAAAQSDLDAANARLAWLRSQWASSHYGGQNPDQMQGFYDTQASVISAAQAKLDNLKSKLMVAKATASAPAAPTNGDATQANIDALQARINALNATLDTSGSQDPAVIAKNNTITAAANALQAQVAGLTATLNSQAAKPLTAAQTIQAARDYVDQQAQYARIAAGPQADYGRGTMRRNDFYKGLGGLPMRGLFGLDARATTPKRLAPHRIDERKALKKKRGLNGFGLGFDFNSMIPAIEQGALKGVRQYAASADKGQITGLPGLNISGPSLNLPSWITSTASVIGKPFSAIANNVAASVNAARNAPAPRQASPITQATPAAPARSHVLAYAGVAVLILGGIAYARRS